MADNADEPKSGTSEDFLHILEDGVKQVLSNRKSKSSERVAAISAGAKLLMIRHKISGADEESFFK